MRDMTFDDLSCEEVFEFNAVCDEWQNDAIKAQDADQQRKELKKEWEAIPEAERPTWEQFKRGLKRKKK